MIDLYSDTHTRPTAGMRRAMAEAEVGDEQQFADPTVNALCERVADLLGKEAAVLFPTGTQSNLAAIYLGGGSDYAKALHWYREAVLGGHERSRYYLGMMYARGLGMEAPDYTAAYALLDPLVRDGDESSADLLAEFKDEMSADELAEARAFAEGPQTREAMVAALD